MICNFCGGVAHPSTGCVYGDRTIACYSCVISFWIWAKQHINKPPRNKKWKHINFYECATKWKLG